MLQNHENGVFKSNNKLKCDVYLKVFPSKLMHSRDYKKHTSELFACQICDKKFTKKVNLVRHQATSTGTKSIYLSNFWWYVFIKSKLN